LKLQEKKMLNAQLNIEHYFLGPAEGILFNASCVALLYVREFYSAFDGRWQIISNSFLIEILPVPLNKKSGQQRFTFYPRYHRLHPLCE